MPFTISSRPARSRMHILQERALYTAIAVLGSLIVTAAISLGMHGKVRLDFMITAFVCSFVVSVPMTALFQRLNRELEDALERERALLVQQERQGAWRESMATAQQHVNDLANSLQLVEVEYNKCGYITPETVATLQEEIHRTGREMRRLGMLHGARPESPGAVSA